MTDPRARRRPAAAQGELRFRFREGQDAARFASGAAEAMGVPRVRPEDVLAQGSEIGAWAPDAIRDVLGRLSPDNGERAAARHAHTEWL